jgi:hypothetical protein
MCLRGCFNKAIEAGDAGVVTSTFSPTFRIEPEICAEVPPRRALLASAEREERLECPDESSAELSQPSQCLLDAPRDYPRL